jgi:hypothetical protein
MAFLRISLLLMLSLRLLGGDGGVLQAVAWAGMLVSRAPEMGIAAAVETTFDGAHPCPLCTAIGKTEKPAEEQTPLPENVLAKLKLKDTVPTGELLLPPPSTEWRTAPLPLSQEAGLVRNRRDAPPVPPPQAGNALA